MLNTRKLKNMFVLNNCLRFKYSITTQHQEHLDLVNALTKGNTHLSKAC